MRGRHRGQGPLLAMLGPRKSRNRPKVVVNQRTTIFWSCFRLNHVSARFHHISGTDPAQLPGDGAMKAMGRPQSCDLDRRPTHDAEVYDPDVASYALIQILQLFANRSDRSRIFPGDGAHRFELSFNKPTPELCGATSDRGAFPSVMRSSV